MHDVNPNRHRCAADCPACDAKREIEKSLEQLYAERVGFNAFGIYVEPVDEHTDLGGEG